MKAQTFDIVRQDIIVDSVCFRVIQISHHKLKHVANLRNTLKSVGYTIRGFPVIYWQKSSVSLVVDSTWIPTTNTNFFVYTHTNTEKKDFLKVVQFLTEAKACILVTKYHKMFLDTPRLTQLKSQFKTTTYPRVDILTDILVEKQKVLPNEQIIFMLLELIETKRA